MIGAESTRSRGFSGRTLEAHRFHSSLVLTAIFGPGTRKRRFQRL
jgi:hypothetical protein